jgi:hypothetical protein
VLPRTAWAGLTARSSVGLTNVTLSAGVPPKDTVAPPAKSCPWIVTVVPPYDGPSTGEIDCTTGCFGA